MYKQTASNQEPKRFNETSSYRAVPPCGSSRTRRGDHTAFCSHASEEGQAFFQGDWATEYVIGEKYLVIHLYMTLHRRFDVQ